MIGTFARVLERIASLSVCPAGAFLGVWLTGGFSAPWWVACLPTVVSLLCLLGSFALDDVSSRRRWAEWEARR